MRILIADDDPVTIMDLRVLLEECGHQIAGEASNGEDACRLARNARPDVAILDVMMPRMSGLEAAAEISRNRYCPVVLLTAYSEAPIIDEATQAGVLAYLVKPFGRQSLEPTLGVAVARYRELCALEGERDTLHEQNETRRLVGKAKGILMARHNLSDREAFRRMQAQSLSVGKSLREIAEAILLTEDLDGPGR